MILFFTYRNFELDSSKKMIHLFDDLINRILLFSLIIAFTKNYLMAYGLHDFIRWEIVNTN